MFFSTVVCFRKSFDSTPSKKRRSDEEIEHFDAGNTIIAVAQIPKVSQAGGRLVVWGKFWHSFQRDLLYFLFDIFPFFFGVWELSLQEQSLESFRENRVGELSLE